MSEPSKEIDAKGYWRDVIRLTLSLLVIWFVVSYGAGILFRDLLDDEAEHVYCELPRKPGQRFRGEILASALIRFRGGAHASMIDSPTSSGVRKCSMPSAMSHGCR